MKSRSQPVFQVQLLSFRVVLGIAWGERRLLRVPAKEGKGGTPKAAQTKFRKKLRPLSSGDECSGFAVTALAATSASGCRVQDYRA